MEKAMYNVSLTEAEKDARIKELEKQNKKLIAGKIVSYVAAGAAVIAAVYCCKKLKDVSGVVNSAVTDISSLTFIDVEKAVVDRAVEHAAQNAANRAVKATERAMQDTVDRSVTVAVAQCKEGLKNAVVNKIAEEVASIDKTEIIEDVTAKAKTLMVQKLDGKLDGIASEFSKNLENVGKIYQSIANTMTAKAVGGV